MVESSGAQDVVVAQGSLTCWTADGERPAPARGGVSGACWWAESVGPSSVWMRGVAGEGEWGHGGVGGAG